MCICFFQMLKIILVISNVIFNYYRRINPFDQASSDITTDKQIENAAFCQTFEVRFLGSMEVKQDRGRILQTLS